MKKHFFSLLLTTVFFALNGAAQTTLVGSTWLFKEAKGEAITFNLTFEAAGKATWKQTNGPNTGAFTWSGTPDNLNVEGPFGSGSTLKMTGNITTGKLSYSSPWSSGGKSGTQTGDYNATSDTWKASAPASAQPAAAVSAKGPVNISSASLICVDNKNTLAISGTLAGAITAYTVDLISSDGTVTRVVTNQQSGAGPFNYSGVVPVGLSATKSDMTPEQAVKKAYDIALTLAKAASTNSSAPKVSWRAEGGNHVNAVNALFADATKSPVDKISGFQSAAQRCLVLNSNNAMGLSTDFSNFLASTKIAGPFQVKVTANRQVNHSLPVELKSACN
jgi:hypothetical protein